MGGAVPCPAQASLLLVGCGKMGSAMLQGWVGQGIAPGSVVVVDPHARDVPNGVCVLGSAAELPPELSAETVILAVKPQGMAEVVPAYARFAGPQTVFLSIAAGKTVAFFRTLLGPEARIVRAMPNTPAAVARGMTVLFAEEDVSPAQRGTCDALLKAVGQTDWIGDEALMDAVVAVSGSGPAYVFHLVEAMAEAGEALGLPADVAMRLARATVSGAGELLHQSPDSAATLREAVTSPGGTTAAALEVLRDAHSGLPPLMQRTLAACARRSRELA